MQDTYLKLSPTYNGCDCYDCGCQEVTGVTAQPQTIEDIIKGLSESDLYRLGLIRLTPGADGKLDKMAVTTLRKCGWAHPEAALNREEKKAMEQEYYLLDTDPNHHGYAYQYVNKLTLVDLDNIHDNHLDKLANGAKIGQIVTAKSVLPDAAYKRYQAALRRKEEAAVRRKEASKAKEEAKKRREIEKAKKILEDAQVPVGFPVSRMAEVGKKVLEQMKARTPEESRQFMIKAGLLDADGRLADEYLTPGQLKKRKKEDKEKVT